MNLTWTENEKMKLLEALQKYGVHNLEVIADHVGSKTVAEVKYAIYLYENAAKGSLKEVRSTNRSASIDKWINVLKKIPPITYASKDIVTAFRLIAQYEESQESDVNLSDCYDFIADLMSGNAPKKLNEETEKFLLLCMVKLSAFINEQDNSKEKKFLENLKYETVMQQSYMSKTKNASVITDTSLNLLKVPKELLKMKKTHKI